MTVLEQTDDLHVDKLRLFASLVIDSKSEALGVRPNVAVEPSRSTEDIDLAPMGQHPAVSGMICHPLFSAIVPSTNSLLESPRVASRSTYR